MFTEKQLRFLFVLREWELNKPMVSPSLTDIAKKLGVTPWAAQNMAVRLKKLGVVSHTKGKARSVFISDLMLKRALDAEMAPKDPNACTGASEGNNIAPR